VRALLDGGAHRAGEIVVLLRATGDLHTFERALLDADVPTYVVGGRGYWAQREVRDLLAYLAVIANPRDEPALYEVLASPLVGASSDALTLLAAAGRARGDGPWPALLASVAPEAGEPSELARALPEVDRGALAAFARLLLEERAGAPRRPLEALLGRALAATDYDLTLLGRPHGARRLANVRKLLRLAREYEAGEGRELRGFLEHVERLGGDLVEQDRESEAPVSADGLDAVRLMTIHRAKGLEFPVVCVADLGRGARGGPDALVRLEDDGRVGLQLLTLDEAARRPAFAYAALGDEQRAREAEEERRLFYVAMTRAEGRLILSGAIRFDPWPAPRPGEPPIAWIAPALVPEIGAALAAGERFEGARTYEGRRVRVSVARNRSADEAARGVPARQPSGADAPRERAGAPAGPAPDARPPAPTLDLPPPPARASRLSYSALQSHARCGYRFYVERELGLPATPSREPRAPAGAQLPAALRGTLVHALLERLDFGRPAALEAHAVRELAAAHGARATDADVADLSELVARFAASPLCARLAAAAGVRREAGFLFALGAGGTGTLLSGVVDVLAREPGGTLIVDYKSDRVGTQPLGELVERSYGIQQRVYALAALRAGAATVEIAHCFLERPAEPVLARFDPSDVAALEGALAPLAERVALRDFPVSRAPGPWVCDGCPARGSLCSWPLAATIGEPA